MKKELVDSLVEVRGMKQENLHSQELEPSGESFRAR